MTCEWHEVEGGNTVSGLIGAWGFKASNFKTTDDLLKMARVVFNIPAEFTTCVAVASYIYSLSKRKRRELGRSAIKKFPQHRKKITENKRGSGLKFASKPINEQPKNFYKTWEWKQLRYAYLKTHLPRCECCGATPDDRIRIVVDHIKSIRRFPELRLDPANLQMLCNDCNMGKGTYDETDWRTDNVVSLDLIREQLKPRD